MSKHVQTTMMRLPGLHGQHTLCGCCSRRHAMERKDGLVYSGKANEWLHINVPAQAARKTGCQRVYVPATLMAGINFRHCERRILRKTMHLTELFCATPLPGRKTSALDPS